MKKLLSTLLVIACCWMAMPAQAQVRFGLKGGVDISKVRFSINDLSSDNRTGFFIGPMLDMTLPIVGLGVDVAALYSQSTLDVKENGYSSEKLKSIEVPLNLKWTFGLGSTAGIFLAAGPQFGFSLNDDVWEGDTKKCIVSVNVGGGIKLASHVQIGLNYNIGASKIADRIIGDDNKNYETGIRKNSWQVSLAYIF